MDAFADFAWSTVLAAPVTPTAGTSITLALGTGARFPTVPYYVVAKPPNLRPLYTNAEILRVTARVGDVLTVARAQSGSAAKTIAIGWEIYNFISAEVLADIAASLVGSAWRNGAGVPSDLVGTNGDYYVRDTVLHVYRKTAGTWGTPIAQWLPYS